MFPLDSASPPSGNALKRANSPSDVVFAGREGPDLTYFSASLGAFTVSNTVVSGINRVHNQTTGGEGAASGQQVHFDLQLLSPFNLLGDRYFFVPQVQLDQGDFLWLSAARPVGASGTPLTPDLQSWIRDQNLWPDWLRIGTDVIWCVRRRHGAVLQRCSFADARHACGTRACNRGLMGVGLFALLGLRPGTVVVSRKERDCEAEALKACA